MAKIAFKKGLLANLPATYSAGTFYVTTDERAIYLDVSDAARIRIGDFQEFATLSELEANSNPSTSALYYVADINCLAKWNGEAYMQINRDTGATDIELVGNGNIITSVSYDENTRKITLTRGATAMTAADVDSKITAAEDNYYSVVRNDSETDNAAITRALGENTAAKGDICVIKTALGTTPESYSFMGYVYDGANWGAMDGNVNSANVIMGKDIVFAGGYASVGNIVKGTTYAKGKTLDDFMQALFTQELNPSKPTPTCSITLTGAGAKEVGSTFTPSYKATFDKKAYDYKPKETGVTVTSWEIKDSNDATKTADSGSFDAFTVEDATSYKITAKANYSDGNVPVTNLGNPYAASQIKAGATAVANSGTVTGYRNWFIYVGTDVTSAVDSAFIRKATAKGTGKNASTQSNVTIPAGTKRIMVAMPAGSGYTKVLKSVTDVDGMGLDVTANFAESTVAVEGANSYTAMNYKVYVAENANGMSATRYTFVIG